MNPISRNIVTFLAFCILLGVMTNGALQPKHKRGPWAISPDARKYIAQVQHRWDATRAPFKYRWAMPELVRQVTLRTEKKELIYPFIILNIMFMAGLYTFMLMTTTAIGVPFKYGLAGILSIFVFWHIYLVQNLFVVDSPALMFTMIAIYAVVTGRWWLFVTAVVVGIQFKESVLFIAPLWFVTRNFGWAMTALVIAVLGYLAPRIHLGGMESYLFVHGRAQSYVNLTQPSRFVYYGLSSWAGAWITGIGGVLMSKRKDLLVALWCLGIGSTVTLWFAGDFGRMLCMMAPVMGVGGAVFFWKVLEKEVEK